MSISSIVQIAERLLNGNPGRDQQSSGKSKSTQRTTQGQNNQTEFGDRFTRSGETVDGNAAGESELLQVESLRFTVVNIQSKGGNATATAPPAATLQATTAAPPLAAATAGAPGGAPASTGGTTTALAPAIAATVASPTTVALQNIPANAVALPITAATPSTVQTQQDLQSLNASLSALGLNAAEIAAFDQFASVLLQFDPNALQDLQNQLNLLAAQFQTQNAPATTTPARNAAPAAEPIATVAAPPTANSPGFQLNELSISFKSVHETLNQGTQNGGPSATSTLSAFSLQIKEVSVTLTNPAGQTTQVQSPQTAAAPTAAAPVSQAAQAATA